MIIDESRLAPFVKEPGVVGRLRALYAEQLSSWPELRQGVEALNQVKMRQLDIESNQIQIQINPGRIKSVVANIDPKAISQRPCFLCESNFPKYQAGIEIVDKFVVLCNPFPIFREHFTVNYREHVDQKIINWVPQLIQISELIGPQFVVFFNGALAGASAPDHMHFQIAPARALPALSQLELNNLKFNGELSFNVTNYCSAKRLILSGSNREHLCDRITQIMTQLDELTDKGSDLVNILAHFDNDNWIVTIVPRSKHRPSCFYHEDETKLLISPGCVELSGVIVTPRKEDFDKISPKDVANILNEVTASDDIFMNLVKSLLA